MPVILATQEEEIKSIPVQSQPRQIVRETLSQKNPAQKKGLVDWFKVYTLSSNPRTKKRMYKVFTVEYKVILHFFFNLILYHILLTCIPKMNEFFLVSHPKKCTFTVQENFHLHF
jgi:hypothetical protein